MIIKASPTLELAQRVSEARARGERAYSFSTPTFAAHNEPLILPPDANLALTPAAGLPELRTLAGEVLFGKWSDTNRTLLITTGAKAVCFCVLKAVTRPGDRVLIVAPAWPSYADICEAAGVSPVLYETCFGDGFAIIENDLAKAAETSGAKAIVLANPNNPSGRIHTRDELAALHRIAEARGMSVVLDESFSEITFDDALWRSAVVPDTARLFVLNSFSKNFHLQGLRLGAALMPDAMAEAVTSVHQAILSAAPSASQLLALGYLKRGSGVAKDYACQHQRAMAFVQEMGWPCRAAEGTFYLFPKLENAHLFAERAAERRVHALTGEAFGPAYADHVRLCFGKPIEELEAMFAALDGLAKAA